VGIAVAYRRQRGPGLRAWARPALGAAAGVLVAGGALGGWWWLANLLRYGELQPAGYVPPRGTIGPLGLPEFLGAFLARIRWNFFLEVGGREAPELGALTAVLTIVLLGLAVAGALALRRPGDRLVVLLGVAATFGLYVDAAYQLHRETLALPGIQGRYLYVLLVPLAALVAVGVSRLASAVRLPERRLVPLAAAGGLAVAILGAFLGLRVFYADVGDPLSTAVRRLLDWAVWPPAGLVAVAAAAVLAGLALVLVARPPAPPGDTRTPEQEQKVTIGVTETP
jgi:hypothetical protein